MIFQKDIERWNSVEIPGYIEEIPTEIRLKKNRSHPSYIQEKKPQKNSGSKWKLDRLITLW